MTHKNYAGPEWQAVRKIVLARDLGVCQIKGAKCKHRATEVDHILNVDDGGARLDPSNLRAACKSCNVSKRNTEVAARARRARGEAVAEVHSARWSSYAPQVDYSKLTPEELERVTGYRW